MKKILSGSAVLLAAACLNVGSLSAATVDCTPLAPVSVATISNTFGSPSGVSINCGPVTFSNFQAVNAGGAPVGLGVFTVSPSTYDSATGTVNIAFNPNFSVPLSGSSDIHFFFDVTAAAGWLINGVDGTIGGTNSHYTEYVCSGAGGYVGSGGCGSTTLATFSVFSPNGTQDLMSFAGKQSIGIYKDIQSIGPGGALTGFGQSFHVAGTVPEPASLSMMGLGLLGLGLVGRRKRKV